jgi:hypothetical protein
MSPCFADSDSVNLQIKEIFLNKAFPKIVRKACSIAAAAAMLLSGDSRLFLHKKLDRCAKKTLTFRKKCAKIFII